jgi:hypothetical protein
VLDVMEPVGGGLVEGHRPGGRRGGELLLARSMRRRICTIAAF